MTKKMSGSCGCCAIYARGGGHVRAWQEHAWPLVDTTRENIPISCFGVHRYHECADILKNHSCFQVSNLSFSVKRWIFFWLLFSSLCQFVYVCHSLPFSDQQQPSVFNLLCQSRYLGNISCQSAESESTLSARSSVGVNQDRFINFMTSKIWFIWLTVCKVFTSLTELVNVMYVESHSLLIEDKHKYQGTNHHEDECSFLY